MEESTPTETTGTYRHDLDIPDHGQTITATDLKEVRTDPEASSSFPMASTSGAELVAKSTFEIGPSILTYGPTDQKFRIPFLVWWMSVHTTAISPAYLQCIGTGSIHQWSNLFTCTVQAFCREVKCLMGMRAEAQTLSEYAQFTKL